MMEPATQEDNALNAEALARLSEGRRSMLDSIHRVIVGQEAVVESLLIVLFTGSHGLITGAPGLAKTLLIRTIARILDLKFRRIQFTPDLMPADITGTEILDEDRATGHRELRFVEGPIFTNILLADEINRTPPKTQAALLEAMEEKQVTVAGAMRPLTRPFYVLATQNPIELEGTYPLPEAQLDRFMLNVQMDYLPEDEEVAVATRNEPVTADDVAPVFTGDDMLAFSRMIRQAPVADPVARYAIKIVQASRPGTEHAPDFVNRWVAWGAGTRGSQNLVLAARARALFQGRVHVACEDIKAVAPDVLRHRVLTSFQAEADKVTPDDVLARLIEHVPEPSASLP